MIERSHAIVHLLCTKTLPDFLEEDVVAGSFQRRMLDHYTPPKHLLHELHDIGWRFDLHVLLNGIPIAVAQLSEPSGLKSRIGICALIGQNGWTYFWARRREFSDSPFDLSKYKRRRTLPEVIKAVGNGASAEGDDIMLTLPFATAR